MKPKTVTRVGGQDITALLGADPALMGLVTAPRANFSQQTAQTGPEGSGGLATKRVKPAQTTDTLLGFALGTTVLTGDGCISVEHLTPGDRIITRDAGFVRLVQLDVIKTTGPAICVSAGTLGQSRPEGDMILPAGQPVSISGWRAQTLFGQARTIVPLHRLVDGEYIRNLGPTAMRLFCLRFERQHVIYADGMECLSGEPVSG